MTRLWERGEPLDALVARFTVGRDPELDRELVAHDALASAAHARMLARIGVLSDAEERGLLAELSRIADEARAGRFEIAPADEDGHTAIENRLTERLGDAGRRIHTGRSRNDQVIAALRLYCREGLLAIIERLLATAERLFTLAEAHRDTSMAGHSHTRQAMPTTMGHLFAAHGEGLLDDLPWLWTAYGHVNRSPLGSASGFGVALPLDRALVAELLGFDGVQHNTLAVQNDRGKTEMLVLGSLLAPAGDLARLAADLIWLSADELALVRLGESVTTGSSIMPQKRNPDVLELVRASAARLRGLHVAAGGILGGLPSGYHRDLQLTKEPLLDGLRLTRDLFDATQRVLDTLQVDVARCRAAIKPAAGATDALYRRVAAGEPLRTAYARIAADPEAAVSGDPAELWRGRTHLGAPGALSLGAQREALARARSVLAAQAQRAGRAWDLLRVADD